MPVFTEKAVKVEREEPQKEKAPIKKMSYKDQREYDTIGDEIAALEEKLQRRMRIWQPVRQISPIYRSFLPKGSTGGEA